jgi:REP element-mobilizing transposase RayT
MAQRGAMCLCFVVMPDHVHWLMHLLEGQSLGTLMQATKSSSARMLNRHFNRNGKFWQSGYHDHALRRDDNVRASARYIVANPIRAGLVRSVRTYPHWDATWL